MKTIKLDVWVDRDYKPEMAQDNSILVYKEIEDTYGTDPIKATLTIEIPEKKITITESEFDKKWEYAIGNNFDEDLDSFKQELGF